MITVHKYEMQFNLNLKSQLNNLFFISISHKERKGHKDFANFALFVAKT